MKGIYYFFYVIISISVVFAQDNKFGTKVKEQAKTSSENRTLGEVDNAVNKTFDVVKEGAINVFKKKDKKKKNQQENNTVEDNANSNSPTANADNNNSSSTNSSKANTSLTYYSKYDFIPGEKVIAVEDFNQDNIGDYPAKWNTNSTGEIVNIEGEQGKWLMLNKQGKHYPEYINNLPENFTLEYDLIINDNFNYYSPPLGIIFATGKQGKEIFDISYIPYQKRSAVVVSIEPTDDKSGLVKLEVFENGEKSFFNEMVTKQINNKDKRKLHVSVWRQKSRLRVYLNEEKVIDSPKAFAANQNFSTILFEILSSMYKDDDRYFISNLKLAIGAPDTRHKLIETGKFSTTGIKFDSGSDKIKPESYGTLKEIAQVLKEFPDVKIKIVGHTDTDGTPEKNLDLSKRRALSVKNALIKEFGIDASRMETDGKGQTEPVDSNSTPEGKANNRRVEFIKL